MYFFIVQSIIHIILITQNYSHILLIFVEITIKFKIILLIIHLFLILILKLINLLLLYYLLKLLSLILNLDICFFIIIIQIIINVNFIVSFLILLFFVHSFSYFYYNHKKFIQKMLSVLFLKILKDKLFLFEIIFLTHQYLIYQLFNFHINYNLYF